MFLYFPGSFGNKGVLGLELENVGFLADAYSRYCDEILPHQSHYQCSVASMLL